MKQSKQKELQLSINGGLVSWNRNLVAWCVFFFILLRLSMCSAGDDIVVYIVARVCYETIHGNCRSLVMELKPLVSLNQSLSPGVCMLSLVVHQYPTVYVRKDCCYCST
jgi:hypothetical protein